MDIKDITAEMNELAVLRLELEQMNVALDELMSSNPDIVALTALIEEKKREKEAKQGEIMHLMDDIGVKSFKTDYANFAVVSKKTVSVLPEYKKMVEQRIKLGEEVEGFVVNESRYLSIRSNK